jgi:hypothetical protein
MEKNLNVKEHLSFKDAHYEKHGLRGHVSIYREDPDTKELSLWDESDNIIPISGYQWILMKMFDLYLDSPHGDPYENRKQDTTIEIADLNNSDQLNIGTDPKDYTPMETNIAESHYVQGFMVGNGGGAEDGITAKNTDYSFTKLRNPIPFQQSSSLDSSIANKYLGVYRLNNGTSVKSYYIKRFDDTPKIIHSWWRSDQAWDYTDYVKSEDLNPDPSAIGKTNRIESYVTCSLSISSTDCQAYFENANNTQDAVINELGLVAFDAVIGKHTEITQLYKQKIKTYLNIVFAHINEEDYTDDEKTELNVYTNEILTVLGEFVPEHSQNNIDAFYNTVLMTKTMIDAEALNFGTIKAQLSLASNIKVEAFYNQNGVYQYENDEFLYDLDQIEFADFDEAQRIKLITYYTFKSIPIQSNVNWKIDYRIYAN